MKEVKQDEHVGQIVGYKKYRESWLGNILERGHYMQWNEVTQDHVQWWALLLAVSNLQTKGIPS